MTSDQIPMDISETDCAAIRLVIEQQLAAFQQDDATGAFAFASPGIQAQFGNAENFMTMVKAAYQAVYRPRSVMFEEIITVEGELAQKVLLMAPEGNLVRALYCMQYINSSWRINGCFLVPLGVKPSS